MGDAVEGGVAGIEAVVRVLEDDLYRGPGRVAVEVAGGGVADRLAIEDDLTGVRVEQAGDEAGMHGFARAAFADEAEAATLGDAEGDGIDGAHAVEGFRHIDQFEERWGAGLSALTLTQPSPRRRGLFGRQVFQGRASCG